MIVLKTPGAARRGEITRRTAVAALAIALTSTALVAGAPAPGHAADLAVVEKDVKTTLPTLEAAVERGMKMFGVPGAAVGVVVGDKLVYAKGFGTRGVDDKAAVDPATVFQVGSTTKAFTATTLAMMVDEHKFAWDSRVVGLYPDFLMHDPWVTREFRVYDLLAQRSGLRPYANDSLSMLGYDAGALIASLRFVEPVTSFRSTFGYVNIPHMVAGRIVATADGAKSWDEVVAKRIFTPLGMQSSSTTAAAIETAPNHATGARWTPDGPVAIPFDASFPYLLGPAGAINSSVDDMAKWVRLLIGHGTFEGKRLVSEQNLAYTWLPKVAINDQMSYALGWVIHDTPHGRIIWHNGGTNGFGAHVGLVPHLGVGVVILSNAENRGFADAAAADFYEALMGNPPFDAMDKALEHARKTEAADKAKFARPADARPARDLGAYAARYETLGFGPVVIRTDGERLIMRLETTGAELALEPFDGDVFTVRLLPVGKFAPIVAMNGDTPIGFAQFTMNDEGRLEDLTWTLGDQPYVFNRAAN